MSLGLLECCVKKVAKLGKAIVCASFLILKNDGFS